MASAAERRWGVWKEVIQMWRLLSHTNGPLEISNSFHPLIHVSVHGDLWMAPEHGGARCFCLADERSVWRLNVIGTKGLNLPLYTMILWGTSFKKNRSYLTTDAFVLICVKLQSWSMILFTSSVCLLSIQTRNVDLIHAHFLHCFKKCDISWFMWSWEYSETEGLSASRINTVKLELYLGGESVKVFWRAAETSPNRQPHVAFSLTLLKGADVKPLTKPLNLRSARSP